MKSGVWGGIVGLLFEREGDNETRSGEGGG